MQRKILFVDDDQSLVSMMNKIFRRKNYDFYSAGTGEEALHTASAITPEIIVLDIALPDTNGFQVCKQLKQNKETAKIPVIMITGKHFTEEDRVQGLEVGADDFISKPVNPDELLARIDAVLRGYEE